MADDFDHFGWRSALFMFGAAMLFLGVMLVGAISWALILGFRL